MAQRIIETEALKAWRAADANQRRAVVIEHTAQGWVASFWGFENMPAGEPLPLPFTSLSTEATVRAHMVAHFPGASVRAIHSL